MTVITHQADKREIMAFFPLTSEKQVDINGTRATKWTVVCEPASGLARAERRREKSQESAGKKRAEERAEKVKMWIPNLDEDRGEDKKDRE